MRVTTILAASLIIMLPGLAMAGEACGWGRHDTSASTCGDNQTWDETSQSCVDLVTG